MRNRRRVLASSFLALALAGCGRAESPHAAGTRQQPRVLPSSPVRVDRIVFGDDLPRRSPLTDPIYELKPSLVKSLLEAGADPNVREGDEATSWPPLALAMRGTGSLIASEDEDKAQREMVKLLLEHGADSNIRWCGDDDGPQCNDGNGMTPLMYAGILGDEDFANTLLRYKADTSLRDWRGLRASDYWGVKTKPASWCASPRPNEPLLIDAHQLVEGKLWENDNAEILQELEASGDRSIEVVTDQSVCELAAVAYARLRLMERTDTAPRSIVPVLVIRVGRVWLADDLRDRGGGSETGVFSRSWIRLGWGMTGS